MRTQIVAAVLASLSPCFAVPTFHTKGKPAPPAEVTAEHPDFGALARFTYLPSIPSSGECVEKHCILFDGGAVNLIRFEEDLEEAVKSCIDQMSRPQGDDLPVKTIAITVEESMHMHEYSCQASTSKVTVDSILTMDFTHPMYVYSFTEDLRVYPHVIIPPPPKTVDTIVARTHHTYKLVSSVPGTFLEHSSILFPRKWELPYALAECAKRTTSKNNANRLFNLVVRRHVYECSTVFLNGKVEDVIQDDEDEHNVHSYYYLYNGTIADKTDQSCCIIL